MNFFKGQHTVAFAQFVDIYLMACKTKSEFNEFPVLKVIKIKMFFTFWKM